MTLTLASFPWTFAIVVFIIAFGIAYVVAHTGAFSVGKPTLRDTLVAMMYSSAIPAGFIIWLGWAINSSVGN